MFTLGVAGSGIDFSVRRFDALHVWLLERDLKFHHEGVNRMFVLQVRLPLLCYALTLLLVAPLLHVKMTCGSNIFNYQQVTLCLTSILLNPWFAVSTMFNLQIPQITTSDKV